VNGLSAHYIPQLAALFGVTVSYLYEKTGSSHQFNSGDEDAGTDAYAAARYVHRIKDPMVRQILVDMTRKFSREGAA
jgi:hypothetical protein